MSVEEKTSPRGEVVSVASLQTGGDWVVEDSSPIRIVAHHYPPSERAPVILATMHIGMTPVPEVKANAALMAQSSDLAWACQVLLSIYDEAERGGDAQESMGVGPAWYDRDAVQYLVSEARVTLAKARPEAGQ